MPLWSVVAEDSHHNATPGGFVIGSSEKASVLAAGLREIITNVPGDLPFNPNWMIDKDDKERKALTHYLSDIISGEVLY